MNIKVSVIIPVYNSEKYLNRCLDSVINQTYNNIEILCINDGSSDLSLKILEQYKSKDNRVVIINNTNHGVSFTRNFGIDKMTGDYYMFLDSDDWLELSAVDKLVKIVLQKKVDVVRYNVNVLDSNSNFIRKENYSNLSNRLINRKEIINNIYRYVTSKNNIHSYSSLLFLKNSIKLKFDESLSFMEDSLYYIQLLTNINNMYYYDDCLYNYYYNTSSTTKNTKNIKSNIESMFLSKSKMKEFLKSYELYEKIENDYDSNTIDILIGQLNKLGVLSIINIEKELKGIIDSNLIDFIKNVKYSGKKYRNFELFLIKRKLFLILAILIKVK